MANKRLFTAEDLKKLREDILSKRDPNKPIITVCSGTGCQSYGAKKVYERFIEEIEKQGLEGKVEVKATGCHGFCEKGVVIIIFPEELYYLSVRLDDVPEIVSTTLVKREIIDRLLYEDPVTGKKGQKSPRCPSIRIKIALYSEIISI